MLDKRKNDDKTKRRPLNPRSRILIALSLVVLVGAGAVLWLMRPSVPYPQFPAAPLYHTSDGHPFMLNLRTGERTQAARFVVPIQPDDPADILAAQALMASDNHKPFEVSPDNQWLVGWKHIRDQYEWELRLYDRYGRGRSRALGVFHGIHWGARIRWSPDSQFIVFSAYTPPSLGERGSMKDEELWRVAISSGEIIPLTNNKMRDTTPSFSPDGTQIAYTSTLDGYHRLYIMDLVTGESRLISPDIIGYSPVWSPDGQWLAFMTNQFSRSNDIWIVRPDGTGAQAVVQSPGNDEDPMWLPVP